MFAVVLSENFGPREARIALRAIQECSALSEAMGAWRQKQVARHGLEIEPQLAFHHTEVWRRAYGALRGS